ncbi:MAG: hypothetical protein WC807_16545 [Hyphomicrobium sp.]|jgi:hypothetical protein
MAKVLVPGKPQHDPHKSKPVWLRVLTKLVLDVAARPRVLGPRILIVGMLSTVYVMLGLPYFRFEYTYYGSADDPSFVSCDYVGIYKFQKQGPECPIVVFRKWSEK